MYLMVLEKEGLKMIQVKQKILYFLEIKLLSFIMKIESLREKGPSNLQGTLSLSVKTSSALRSMDTDSYYGDSTVWQI